MGVPVKVLLLQNSLHDWGFNLPTFHSEEKPTTGRQKHSAEGLQRFEMTAVFAVQLCLCQELTCVINRAPEQEVISS